MRLNAAQPGSRRGQHAGGFSQLEMIITISVAGLMSVAIIPAMLPHGGKSTAAYQALRLADDLRHTRLLAMAWGTPLVFSTDNDSYRVSCVAGIAGAGCSSMLPPASLCPNPSPTIIDPGHNGPFCIALENGVTLSGPAAVQFDALGRPQSLAGTLRYRLRVGSETLATVDIAPVTGFVSSMVAP